MMFNTFAYSGSWDEPELIFSAMRWHPNLTNILICFVRAVNTSMQITWASVMCHRCNSHSLEWLQYIICQVRIDEKEHSWIHLSWKAGTTTIKHGELRHKRHCSSCLSCSPLDLIVTDRLDHSQKPIRSVVSGRLSSESSSMELRYKSVVLESVLQLWAWTNH